MADAAVNGHDTETRPPVVIYIAGSGRSGSTVLERTLGGAAQCVNVGEVIDLFRKVGPRDELCGCGLPFSKCPFWTGVGQRAFGGWTPALMADVHRLQRAVARQRHLPSLMAPRLASARFARDLSEYGRHYREIYDAIAARAGTRYVVDASKWPVQAFALWRTGIDVRVIHLIRDVRGVAHSQSKRDVPRPHVIGRLDVMWRNPPVSAAARWLLCQTEVDALSAYGVPVARIRYEDFVRDPRPVVGRALERLQIPLPANELAHITDDRLLLGPSHGLSGNPSRFDAGDVQLRADESWRSQMSGRDRAMVTAVGLPHLLRHRASGRTAGGRPRANGASDRDRRQTISEPTEWPTVSVIVPTRGRPELVRDSLAAIVGQSYPGAVQCLVIHDQEPVDATLAEPSTALHTVAVTANTHKPGLAGARNTGVELCTGKFIATCDDDDVWHAGKLEAQIGRLLDEPDLLVVGSGIRLRLPGGKTAEWRGRADRIAPDLLLRNRVKELHSSTLVMHRDAFAKAGRYDEDLPNGYAEDYDWVLRVSRVGRIGVVREPLADIRKDVQSWYVGRAQNTLSGLESFLAKHPEVRRSARGHARMLGQIAFVRSTLGQRRLALRYAATSLVRWPLSPHAYFALIHITTGIDHRRLAGFARVFGRGTV